MFDNKDFIRAVFDSEVRSQQLYNEVSAAPLSRDSERRATEDRRKHVPWVVDPNDRRSGYDRRTGLDRRGNSATG